MPSPTRKWWFTAAALLLAAIVLFPVYWMALTSVLPSELTRSRTPVLWPKWSALSLDAFTNILARKPVFTWLANSVIVTVVATFISLIIATLAGIACRASEPRAAGCGICAAGVENASREPDRDSVLHRILDLRPDR